MFCSYDEYRHPGSRHLFDQLTDVMLSPVSVMQLLTGFQSLEFLLKISESWIIYYVTRPGQLSTQKPKLLGRAIHVFPGMPRSSLNGKHFLIYIADNIIQK